jgi:hypothetical protein
VAAAKLGLDSERRVIDTAALLVVPLMDASPGRTLGPVREGCSMRSFASVLLACLLAAAFDRAPLYAESSLTPEPRPAKLAPQDEPPTRLTIAVIGDSLGDGLWQGLYLQLRDNKRFTVFRGSKRSVGFTTSDMTEQIDAAFATGPVDALVVMVGANDDRRSFFANGKSLALFATEKWIELYRGRVEGFMDYAAGRKVPFVWVLLPVMRTAEPTSAAQLVNRIVTETAAGRPHVALVPIWSVTADDKGAYMPYFNDLRGRRRLMRHSDGVHFSESGYEVLAHVAFSKLLEISPRFMAAASPAAAAPVR